MTDASDTALVDVARRLARVESELALQRLVADSTRCIDRADRTLFASGWWDDSVWNLGPPFEPFVGIARILEAAEDVLWSAWVTMHHVVGNLDLELATDDEDAAAGVSEVHAITVLPDRLVHVVAATYRDVFSRRAGEWRIARRDVATRLVVPLPGVRAQSLDQVVR